MDLNPIRLTRWFILLGAFGATAFGGAAPEPPSAAATEKRVEPVLQVFPLALDGRSNVVSKFTPGSLLFANRAYTLAECPAELRDLRYFRTVLEGPTYFECVEPGYLYVATPTPAEKDSASQARALEALGFSRVPQLGEFQLFATTRKNRVWVFGKTLQRGEVFRLRSLVVLLGMREVRRGTVALPRSSWKDNDGERLYNGIVLPRAWPPSDSIEPSREPQRVPWLEPDAIPARLPIDVGRQLFVDDFLIESTDLEREYHLARKFAGNPILRPDPAGKPLPRPPDPSGRKRDEFGLYPLAAPTGGGAYFDPADGLFKLWYSLGFGRTGLAVSKDGLHWETPKFDVVPGTNEVMRVPDSSDFKGSAVVLDRESADPAQRYKMYTYSVPAKGELRYSADGVFWGAPVRMGTCGDRTTFFHNPFRGKWVFSLRTIGSESRPRGRARLYREHDDWLGGAQWADDEPVFWTGADELDRPEPGVNEPCQLYVLDGAAYESLLLGVFSVHRGPHNDICQKTGVPKLTEVLLGYSRDGFHWHRPDRRPFIPAARSEGAWDRAYVQGAVGGCVIDGDQLRFYYAGFSGTSPQGEKSFYAGGATGMATLRRDGFASMNAGSAPGTLTTRPVVFKGRHVFVNVDCPAGELQVEILDEPGRPLAAFAAARCRPVAVDSTLHAVQWEGVDDLASLSGHPVRFRFTLRQGKLYSFWVSPEKSGASRGYVAAGGPGYRGAIDDVGAAALAARRSR